MKNISGVLGVGLVVLLYCGTVQAFTVEYKYIAKPKQLVDSISAYDTTGNTMDGMEVIVNLGEDSEETGYWADGIGATGSGWSLTMSDFNASTYSSSYWKFKTSEEVSVQSITLNGFDHNVVFDKNKNEKATPGSAYGQFLDLLDSSSYPGSIEVTYSGLVGLTGKSDSFWYDLYSSMTIGFVGVSFTAGDNLKYWQDTDNIHTPVPEPSTMLLFGFGLVGLAGIRRARKR